MNGKLGYDVSKEEVAVILGGWVHTLLGEQTGPGKGHETTELGSLTFVVGVMDVRGCMFH